MGEYLEQTILSVLGQGYPNLEYIIIDGGSTDNSIEIIKKYESQLAYWISEDDNGMYDAIQKGFERSTGEIMGWINSDDLLMPKSLFVLNEIFSEFDEVEWMQGLPLSLDKQGRMIETGRLKSWSKFYFLTGNCMWIQQESTYWRRSLWERAGNSLNTNLKYAGDHELWMRFFKYADLFSTPALIGGFRFRGGKQITSTMFDEYMKEVRLTTKKAFDDLDNFKKMNVYFFRFIYLIFRILRKLRIDPLFLEDYFLFFFIRTKPFIIYDKWEQSFKKTRKRNLKQ